MAITNEKSNFENPEPIDGNSARMQEVVVGRLAIYVVDDAQKWQGGVAKGDRYLDLDFEGEDWKAIFFDVLHCPRFEYVDEKSYVAYDEKIRRAIPQFPMLGKISDMYIDVGYSKSELQMLREECKALRSTTNNRAAINGLEKLIFASVQALKECKELYLVSD